MHRDNSHCSPDSRERVALSNTAVPYDEQSDVVSSEGDISCVLLHRNIMGSRIERFVWRNDPAPTYVRVLNVHCSIYPENAGHTDTLEQAIRQLPGVSTKPATVPNSYAIHD
jgi:hypothetical protein